MSAMDWILPWKSLPKAWEQTKGASRKDNFGSIFGGFGRAGDIAGNLLGDKYAGLVHETIPRMANKALSPVVRLSERTDPLTHVGGSVGKMADYKADWLTHHPADTLAMVVGGIAAGGAMAGGGAGGAGAQPTPAAQPAATTPAQPQWMDYYQQYSNLPQPGEQQQPSQQQDYEQRRQAILAALRQQGYA